MDGIIAREMEMDAKEERRFVAAGFWERAFMCWKECWDAKKYCILNMIVIAVLLVQIVQLAITPPAFVGEIIASSKIDDLTKEMHRLWTTMMNMTVSTAAAAVGFPAGEVEVASSAFAATAATAAAEETPE